MTLDLTPHVVPLFWALTALLVIGAAALFAAHLDELRTDPRPRRRFP